PGDRPRFPSEDQEGGLEGVFGVLRVAHHAPANAEHHGAMAVHQHRERLRVAPGEESLQQVAVGEIAFGRTTDEPVEVGENDLLLAIQHEFPSFSRYRATQSSPTGRRGAFTISAHFPQAGSSGARRGWSAFTAAESAGDLNWRNRGLAYNGDM